MPGKILDRVDVHSSESLELHDLPTTLKPGRYIEVHEGWQLDVESDGSIKQWDVPRTKGTDVRAQCKLLSCLDAAKSCRG